ncbi:MAG: HAD family phosphatase [Sphingobacteriales bacterium]|nr:MAG: HAD family phosphatase [Sphingobacteriales bacterium]
MELAQERELKYKELCTRCKGDIEAYLYDCDGTLADNMQAHKDAYIRIAKEQGLEIDGTIIDELAGWPTVEVVAEMNRRHNTNFDTEDFARRKSLAFYETIDQTQPIDFVMKHLTHAPAHIKIGVVSGGRRETVTKTLKILGIDHLVQALVCAGDTERGKPAPDPFLLAANHLGVAPEKCIVFEDGEAGVQSAIAAGMKWIRIDKI